MRLEIRKHSPTGFEWGYSGSGPAQLALARCVEVVGAARAESISQEVKDPLVASIGDDRWTLSGALVLEVVERIERSQIHHGSSS